MTQWGRKKIIKFYKESEKVFGKVNLNSTPAWQEGPGMWVSGRRALLLFLAANDGVS